MPGSVASGTLCIILVRKVHQNQTYNGSRDSIIIGATRIWAGGSGICVLTKAKFLSPSKLSDCLSGSPRLLFSGCRYLFSGVIRLTTASSAEVTYEWSCTPTLSVCLQSLDKPNFIFSTFHQTRLSRNDSQHSSCWYNTVWAMASKAICGRVRHWLFKSHPPPVSPGAEPHKSLHVNAQINTHLLLSRPIEREGVLLLAKQWDLHKRKERKRQLIS
jgi:hypothetical protein